MRATAITLRLTAAGAALAAAWLLVAGGALWSGAGCGTRADGGDASALAGDAEAGPAGDGQVALELPRWVRTLAGAGTPGFADGLTAGARFNLPEDVAVDGAGRVYVADSLNHRIRVIEQGTVRTLAGSGTPGFADGLAASARFNRPRGVAVDLAGRRVYVADRLNNAIRVIEGGRVRTVAGASAPGFADGVGTAARFNWPAGLAIEPAESAGQGGDGGPGGGLDGGFADLGGADGGSGDGSVDGSLPTGLNDDRLLIVDVANHRVRRFDGLRVESVSGGGAGFGDGFASGARFRSPEGVAVDGAGVVYVADTLNHRLRRIADGRVSTLAGDGSQGLAEGPPSQSRLAAPIDVAVDSAIPGEARVVYVADRDNHAVRVLVDGSLQTLAGAGLAGFADGLGDSARFNGPSGIVAHGGRVYVADRDNHRIRVISGVRD